MIRVLAVYGIEPSYGERFADYVNQKDKMPFTAMSFSSVEKLRQYGEDHVIEILLVDEEAREDVRDVKANQVMMLCQGVLVEAQEETPAIYKYQSGDCVMREVMARYCCQPVEPALALLGTKAKVIGIYSPVNRCMKSSLALIMCQQIARNETVLYMNLEEYSGFSRLVCDDYKTDLSDVLYLYKQGAYHWMRLKSMVYNWGNVDFIPPVRYGEDLGQVTSEEMALLIGRIARESGYDKVVVDVGQMGHGVLPLLEVCDTVYMPIREDCVSAAKLEEFEAYLEEADQSVLMDRIQKLKLPRPGSMMRKEGYLEQLLFGELGDYVRQLLNGRRPEPY